jgi:dTDP-4-dehydrorhamnose 3,5-epimerase
MSFTATPLAIPDVLLIAPKIHGDTRGFFIESYHVETIRNIIGKEHIFIQDNHSRSNKGVLRGMHWQLPPYAQGKLVRAARGSVFDVAVDIRCDSASYGKWVGAVLSDENHHQLWVPPGFAHGFLVLSDVADFIYKVTGNYTPECEGAFRWDDPAVGIDWPLDDITPQLSTKDIAAPLFADAKTFPAL